MKDPGSFTIPCSIGKYEFKKLLLEISVVTHALWSQHKFSCQDQKKVTTLISGGDKMCEFLKDLKIRHNIATVGFRSRPGWSKMQ